MELAIVGAGVSGLGAAVALADTDIDVTVYERDAAPGGRAATRQRDGCRYDTGANYLKSEDEQVNELVRALGAARSGEGTAGGRAASEEAANGELVDVEEPVWTFDAAGEITEGRAESAHKWTYRTGIAELGERLAARADATLEIGTEVEAVSPAGDESSGGWEVEHGDGASSYDAVLLTPPAPVTADLLAGETEATHELAAEARSIPYRPVLTAALHYPFEVDRPYYALVNTDEEHELGWLARESAKTGHVPDGEAVLIAQMAPDWSAQRLTDGTDGADGADGTDGAATDAARAVADLLDDERLAEPDWTDTIGWRHALADDGTADAMTVARAAGEGLFVAGDWTVGGESRLHTALRGGLDVGAAIADFA